MNKNLSICLANMVARCGGHGWITNSYVSGNENEEVCDTYPRPIIENLAWLENQLRKIGLIFEAKGIDSSYRNNWVVSWSKKDCAGTIWRIEKQGDDRQFIEISAAIEAASKAKLWEKTMEKK